ncbi:Serine carboxypeptidase [Aspergillus parasiticus SU-1]|uniref:Carboxypeptidase n=1 Tax=Aspergillus parasiticus (strain ATCC 56775 / NRRL 5862 / SRRC 143 / SU-1) TaxID=1403190 RepID=A0A0F0IHJ6_ASPPU|nr:Serine carboxypeptidase [Aspergillus parasiticus SU-1]
MLFNSIVPTAILAAALCTDNVSAAKHGRFGQKARDSLNLAKRAAEQQKASFKTPLDDFRFLTNKTKSYRVDHLPDVPFDVGEMYSGLVPIDKDDKSRALFFVFQPTLGDPVDEITIWLNGGPGCSSLEGFFQENGRFTWQPGTFAPVENPYSWVNLTNVLWVEQPVGTGFAIGKPNATTQEETAEDFVRFFKNFQELFGIKNFKIYVTGESYAGRYVPYISAAMLDRNDTEHYDLKGALVYDPCIGQHDYIQEEVPAVPFVQQNANLFNFNSSFMSELEKLHDSCGYKDYLDEYLVFPPAGVQPQKFFNYTSDADCDVFDLISNEALVANSCFDIYEINLMCPLAWDVLAMPTAFDYQPAGATVYFDRPDVKRAMHAPLNVTWSGCSSENVYVGGDAGPEQEGDLSANPIEHVLPQVIEGTNRVLVSNGDYDMIILTNGTLLAIQNMTWNGELGFQSAPATPITIDLPDLAWGEVFEENGQEMLQSQGVMGVQHYERGLMWAETYQSGHMQPQYQPRVSYRHLQWLLGRVDKL